MKEYQKILVTVDGSPQSQKAFEEACHIAERNHAELHLLTVLDLTGFRGTASESSVKLTEELQKIAERNVAELKASTDYPVEAKVAAGNPKHEIVKIAEDLGVDMIVIGETGLNRLERRVLGSTTVYVVNHAKCNVMVVK
ncbi:universal stress protein [Enterococcus sp. 669A]|uniref:Universal stress protein n=1 Tax=Candidatus Enterococcus moelleringii TaxID=2815325 RepID=A0ABS3L979_9ENTE|nr:universal stress protein [Enterococcus sp. 669A]MBO1306191.1 universal stress protein [Enterococcus sp. 669A]